MSRSNSWEVLWSPANPNKFVKYNTSDVSSDICLYNVYNDQDHPPASINKNQVVKLADGVVVCPIAGYSEVSSVKSIAWCPRKDLDSYCILAVGLSNGRVSLLNVGPDSPSNTGLLINQEFAPKAERTCHELAWSEQEPNLLAVGLDKVRYDNSLLVWDVEAKADVAQSPAYNNRTFGNVRKAVFEHGSAEPTVSVCWLSHMPRTLVAGQGTKWLRLFDIRAQKVSNVIATTKAIYGICVDPHNSNRIASFADGIQGAVLIWDIRNYEKPVVTINQAKPVSKILWCPTRNHLISVLQKDSMAVKYYDLQYSSGGGPMHNIDEANDSIVFERNAQLPKSAKYNISSYSWHPSIENTILTISASGNLNYLKIFERIMMSWSPSLDLVWGCGKHMLMCSLDETAASASEDVDISFTMRQRAVNGYGQQSVMKDEKKLREVLRDPFLVKLWIWLKRSRRLKDQGSRKQRKFYGVKAIVKGELNSQEVALKLKGNEKQVKEGRVTRSFIEDKTPKTELLFTKHYTSEDRQVALHLCDWDLTEHALVERLNKLTIDGEPERAAAMALFNNKLSLTIQILSGAQSSVGKTVNVDPSLPIVAMALSGYSENRQTLWAANCKTLSSQLKNSYLRAIFAFLTTEDEDYTNVLRETGMELQDRIAFACRYLSDSKLTNYVENVTTSLITSGSLEGLLLTGLTSDGMDLLENFITKISDVQTAILIILNTKVTEVFRDPRVSNWIENYRDLLDKWGLWHERAQFDSLVQNTGISRKIPQQISVTCTYCSKPVSYNLMSQGGMRMPPYSNHISNSRQNKAMSCPGCRQPLPRCSICLINMGSLSSHNHRTGTKTKLDYIVNSFQNWFTWCQMCRHGGHAAHLVEWFAKHVECPVTGCTCCCNAQDSVAILSPKDQRPVDSSEEFVR